MRIKVLIIIALVLATGLAYRHLAYDAVYTDNANTCEYKNGKLLETTQVATLLKSKLVKSSQVNNYISKAEAAHQCVSS